MRILRRIVRAVIASHQARYCSLPAGAKVGGSWFSSVIYSPSNRNYPHPRRFHSTIKSPKIARARPSALVSGARCERGRRGPMRSLQPVLLPRARANYLANRLANRSGDIRHVGYRAVAVTHRENRERHRDFGAVAADLKGWKSRHHFSAERPLMQPPDFVAPRSRQQNLVGAADNLGVCISVYLARCRVSRRDYPGGVHAVNSLRKRIDDHRHQFLGIFASLALHRRCGRRHKLIKALGLEQIAIQTVLERARHHLFAAVAGQHDYPSPRPSLSHALKDRQPVNPT